MKEIQGSIAGVVIDVKNDEPSRVLVRAILTINSFGENLYDEDAFIGVTKEDYEEIIKRNVIAIYKSILSSELVQMYIRHSIREDGRCPITGSLPEDRKNGTTEDIEDCTTSRCTTNGCLSVAERIKIFLGQS